ncbi:MAG: UPF0104 family protein [Alphaproteobacteria bacterium]|nr:UPF0104 family protein [Alphaproteobacteria bacterium]
MDAEHRQDDPAGFELRPVARGRWARYLPWVFGILALSAIIVVVLHFGQMRRFTELAQRAQPGWLVLAAVVQVPTYLSQGAVWWLTLRRCGHPVTLRSLSGLAIAKLFTDQAVPTGGLSGILLVVQALVRRGVAAPIAMATLVVGIVSFYAAYMLVVFASLALLWTHHDVKPALLWGVTGFVAFSLAIPTAVLWLGRLGRNGPPRWLRRIPGVSRILDVAAKAPTRQLRDPPLVAKAILLHVSILALDGLTLWCCLRAVGDGASLWVAGAAFAMASVAATIGPIPLGLGTFEAGAVGMLSLLHVEVEAALAATLLFRGLTFWLPMLPGLWFARREMRSHAPEAASPK